MKLLLPLLIFASLRSNCSYANEPSYAQAKVYAETIYALGVEYCPRTDSPDACLRSLEQSSVMSLTHVLHKDSLITSLQGDLQGKSIQSLWYSALGKDAQQNCLAIIKKWTGVTEFSVALQKCEELRIKHQAKMSHIYSEANKNISKVDARVNQQEMISRFHEHFANLSTAEEQSKVIHKDALKDVSNDLPAFLELEVLVKAFCKQPSPYRTCNDRWNEELSPAEMRDSRKRLIEYAATGKTEKVMGGSPFLFQLFDTEILGQVLYEKPTLDLERLYEEHKTEILNEKKAMFDEIRALPSKVRERRRKKEDLWR